MQILVRKYVDTARVLDFLFSYLLRTVHIQCTAIVLLIVTDEVITLSWEDPFLFPVHGDTCAVLAAIALQNVFTLRPPLILWSPTVSFSVINIL